MAEYKDRDTGNTMSKDGERWVVRDPQGTVLYSGLSRQIANDWLKKKSS